MRSARVTVPVVVLGAVAVLVAFAADARAERVPPPMHEAVDHLKAAYVAEKAYQQENDVYSDDLGRIGFSPNRGNRYAFYFSAAGKAQLRTGAELDGSAPASIVAFDRVALPKEPFPATVAATKCPISLKDGPAWVKGVGVTVGPTGGFEMEFVVLAAGNLDGDPVLDCWTVASFQRRGPNGEAIPSGLPFHEQADLTKEQQTAAEAEKLRLVVEQKKARLRQVAADRGITDAKEVETFSTLVAWFDATPQVLDDETPPVPATLLRHLVRVSGFPDTDPWGTKYSLVRAIVPDPHGRVFVATTAGPDKVFGTPDDLATVLDFDR